MLKKETNFSRREFIKAAAAVSAVMAVPTIIPASALGKDGRPSPSNRITIGCIGVGGMGSGNMESFLEHRDCQVVAVCDVDKNRMASAAHEVNGQYGNNECAQYGDFRELIARKDIDAISLATPDHWHAIPAILAAQAGKDIYGEKPISHSWLEGRMMCDAVQRHGRIWQTGSWQRSVGNFRQAAELVLNGYIGKVHTIEVGFPDAKEKPNWKLEITSPPPELDYEFWIGPAPWTPYCKGRTHWDWRWQLNYGGGQLMDWIGHHGDIAHWGMGWDYTGPVEVEGKGEYNKQGIYDTAFSFHCTCKYRNDVTMIVSSNARPGTKWIGDKGWIWVDRNKFQVEPKGLMKEVDVPKPINLYRSPGHHRNFLNCVKSRRQTLAPAEVAHRSATIGHLCQVAMLLGRKIQWNPDTEEVIGDPIASQMLRPAMREPWSL